MALENKKKVEKKRKIKRNPSNKELGEQFKLKRQNFQRYLV